MNYFKYRPATPHSINMRKPIKGVGINDADYVVCDYVDGKYVHCPIYLTWSNMIERSYCEKYKKRYPTYKDVTCSNEWLIFSNFKEWMKTKKWHGNSLDKDIMIDGNKIYSKDRCIFVPIEINNIFSNKKQNTRLPSGVEETRHGTYRARLSVNGKYNSLGSFRTIEEALDAHNKSKRDHIINIANKYRYSMDNEAYNYILEKADRDFMK